MEFCANEKISTEQFQLTNTRQDAEQKFITLIATIIVNVTLHKYEDRKGNNISANINRETK